MAHTTRLPTCMWPGCNDTILVPTVRVCVEHAVQVSDALSRLEGRPTLQEVWDKETTPEQRAKAAQEWGKVLDRQRADQEERTRTGRPRRTDMAVPEPQDKVYYILVGQHIKIGYTANVTVRLSNYPPNSELLGIEVGDRQREKERHDQFHAYLAYGREWFNDCDEIREHIATLPPISYTGRKRMSRGPANQVPTVKPRYWR